MPPDEPRKIQIDGIGLANALFGAAARALERTAKEMVGADAEEEEDAPEEQAASPIQSPTAPALDPTPVAPASPRAGWCSKCKAAIVQASTQHGPVNVDAKPIDVVFADGGSPGKPTGTLQTTFRVHECAETPAGILGRWAREELPGILRTIVAPAVLPEPPPQPKPATHVRITVGDNTTGVVALAEATAAQDALYAREREAGRPFQPATYEYCDAEGRPAPRSP